MSKKFIPKVILCKNVKKITIRNATSKSINQEEIRNYTYFIYRIVIKFYKITTIQINNSYPYSLIIYD